MSADKLILLSRRVRKDFQALAEEKGKPRGGYSHFLDLQKTKFQLPVRLYCGGHWTGINKIEFVDVATLGYRRVDQIVGLICPNRRGIRIARIDWALDILGLSVWDLAGCCQVAGVTNCAFYRSRGGVSFYPHKSNSRSILIYERAKRLKQLHDPSAALYEGKSLTRLEVQLKGKGVPIREYLRLSEYAHYNVLRDVTFSTIIPTPKDLKPREFLMMHGLRSLVAERGLQSAAKMFTSSQWAYLRKKYLDPVGENFPDLHALMKKSVLDWLENRIRFPRW